MSILNWSFWIKNWKWSLENFLKPTFWDTGNCLVEMAYIKIKTNAFWPNNWCPEGVLELNFFLVFVKKMKFGHVIIIVGMYPYGLLIFSSPIPFFAEQPASFGQVCMHDRVHCEDQILMLVIEQITKIFLNFILQD